MAKHKPNQSPPPKSGEPVQSVPSPCAQALLILAAQRELPKVKQYFRALIRRHPSAFWQGINNLLEPNGLLFERYRVTTVPEHPIRLRYMKLHYSWHTHFMFEKLWMVYELQSRTHKNKPISRT